MAINVNRVTLGLNCKCYDTSYFRRLSSGCPASSTPLSDGSTLICKSGGVAWFVSPISTQIGSQWANGQYNSTAVGTKCCISEWGVLGTCLSDRGYTPTEWFVPTKNQLLNPGSCCRSNWQCSTELYHTATEGGQTVSCTVCFNNSYFQNCPKSGVYCVRAFRCVTY
jgi:hypothetical protein